MSRRTNRALLLLLLVGLACPAFPQASGGPSRGRVSVQLDERGFMWRGSERVTRTELIDAAKKSTGPVVIELEPNAPSQALDSILASLKEASIIEVDVVPAPSAGPFFTASRDLGYRIVMQEYGRTMGIGRGHHVPPAGQWDVFTQLELSLNKVGVIVSAHSVYGSDLPEFTERLLGKSMRGFPGGGRVSARVYLKRESPR